MLAFACAESRSFVKAATLLLLVLTGTACARRDDVHTVGFVALGTNVSISIAGDEGGHAASAIAEIQALMQRLSVEWYPWTPDHSGELARLNDALARGDSLQVSPELASLLLTTRDMTLVSGGGFDPAVGKLVELWGFTTGDRSSQRPAPSEAAIVAWVADHPRFADLEIQGTRVSSSRRDLKIDLGAIGKGRVIDLAVAILRAHGIHNAVVNAGGKLRAIGTVGTRAWRIGIRDPRRAGTLGGIDVQGDESVSTSGDYERFAIVQGQRVHHLLDPRTGRPTAHTEAVTVLAADATTADGASTAIFLAGPAAWQEVARNLGIRDVLRVDANGTLQISRSLRDRLHLSPETLKEAAIEVVEM
jgi:thiamine biosynthesis lipoprotein